MKIRTHLKLAQLAFDNKIKKTPVGFSSFMFKLGTIIADESWLVKTHPHYSSRSLDYILDKIEKLSSKKRFNLYSSLELGIIVHYLCDFCCSAHKNGCIGNPFEHMKYERDILKYLLENFDILKNIYTIDSMQMRNLSAAFFKKPDIHIKYKKHGIEYIKHTVRNMVTQYNSMDSSFITDIRNSVKLSFLVCSSIFNYSISCYESSSPVDNIAQYLNYSFQKNLAQYKFYRLKSISYVS